MAFSPATTRPDSSSLKAVGKSANQRLLEAERLADDGSFCGAELEQLQRPALCDGHRVAALRFGDPRTMALLAALGQYSLQPHGFRNRDLRRLVEPLLGGSCKPQQVSYDLRRLRRRGPITRLPGTYR